MLSECKIKRKDGGFVDILEGANQLGKGLKESVELKRYREAEVRFLSSDEAQKGYNEYRSLYSEYLKTLDKKLEKEVDDKYNELLRNEIFSQYLESKNHYDKLVNSVYDIIGYHAGVKKKSCGGCGGCSKK